MTHIQKITINGVEILERPILKRDLNGGSYGELTTPYGIVLISPFEPDEAISTTLHLTFDMPVNESEQEGERDG